jgi:hypothetical protein
VGAAEAVDSKHRDTLIPRPQVMTQEQKYLDGIWVFVQVQVRSILLSAVVYAEFGQIDQKKTYFLIVVRQQGSTLSREQF